MRTRAFIAVGVVLLMVAGGVAYYATRITTDDTGAEAGDLAPAAAGGTVAQESSAGDGALPDVMLTLAPDVVTLAGVVVEPVAAGMVASRVTVSGSVELNAARQSTVSAPAAGRIARLHVQVGAVVEAGQPLAIIDSPDLALAEGQLFAARTTLAQSQQELAKMERLAEIGAVSRQEVDRVRADASLRAADFDAARSRLAVLGLPPESLAALLSSGTTNAALEVRATAGGTVGEIAVAEGQSVDVGARLLTTADLSSVWVAADVSERDLARVHTGGPATVTVADLPDRTFTGVMVFVQPEVNVATHSSHVRVEVQNPRSELRAGMTAELELGDEGSVETALVPREAVQNVGTRQVVYLAAPETPGAFIEREVHLGAVTGEQVAVLSGVSPSDRVVGKGSAFLKTERERLGLRPSAPIR